MKNLLTCLLYVLLLLAPALISQHLSADDRIVVENDSLAVIADAPLREEAGYFLGIAARVRADLRGDLGWQLPYRPTLVLVGDRERFVQMSGNPYFSAFAVPERGLVIMRVAVGEGGRYRLNETFRHELCHLFLHAHIEGDRLPKWLDEGVCQWLSGSLGEIDITGTPAEVDLAARRIPLWRLDQTFPGERGAMRVAYEQSRRVVDYIARRYGRDRMFGILYDLAAGVTLRQAFIKRLGVSVDELEAEWVEADLSGGEVWLRRIANNLYPLVFGLTACLAVVAFVVRAIRRRRWDDEEDGDDARGEDDEDAEPEEWR